MQLLRLYQGDTIFTIPDGDGLTEPDFDRAEKDDAGVRLYYGEQQIANIGSTANNWRLVYRDNDSPAAFGTMTPGSDTWLDLILLNGATGRAQYMKMQNVIYVTGSVALNTASQTVLCALPKGFWPSTDAPFSFDARSGVVSAEDGKLIINATSQGAPSNTYGFNFSFPAAL